MPSEKSLQLTDSQLCKSCLQFSSKYRKRCETCYSPRLVKHPELFQLQIAHIDCDAFYASVEKNENPNLRDLPVIVGGTTRGVVATCCYIARIYGVRSAMPISTAKKLCPSAVFLRPRINHYKGISQIIKSKLLKLTPNVEFVSLDEAYIDLSGTIKLHRKPPAVLLALIANEIETSLGLSVSVGLSFNKFLAKIASEADKPRGFSVIGHRDYEKVLQEKSVKVISGVGRKTFAQLDRHGIEVVSDLLRYEKHELNNMFGRLGNTLWNCARGVDTRPVVARKPIKSISCEKTFDNDEANIDILKKALWRQCENLSKRAKKNELFPQSIKLKLKTSDFRLIVASGDIRTCTNSAEIIFQGLLKVLYNNLENGPFRLIGVSLSRFRMTPKEFQTTDLFDDSLRKINLAEEAIDEIREKFGPNAIIKGRALNVDGKC